MELVKKNIHMDRIKCKANTQITLEDDVNVSDNRPDVGRLILDKGDIKTEEIKATADHVNVKGKLCFSVLYLPEGEKEGPCRMEGSIPFEEQIYMEGAQNGDNVGLTWELEDLRIGMINSRKLSVQAVISLHLSVEELYDEETAVELYHDEPVECRKRHLDLAEIAIQKRDIFRIKEELELPQNDPNILNLVWDSVRLGEMEFRPLDEKISIQGEMTVFILYEGEGEDEPVRWYEEVLPLSGSVDCHGCREGMIPDISCTVGHRELETRADFDGEERIIGLELVLDLDIKLYEEEQVDILSDVYGVTRDIRVLTKPGSYNRLLVRNAGKTKLAERFKVKTGSPRILSVCHCDGEVQIEDTVVAENGIHITGILEVDVLYTSGEEAPFASHRESIPFQYTLEAPGVTDTCIFRVEPALEQLTISMADSEEMDMKAVLGFKAVVFCSVKEDIVTDIEMHDLDPSVMKELPGIVAYIARDGDSLWQLGKKYYVPIEQMKETNHLSSEELKAGDKILIVR